MFDLLRRWDMFLVRWRVVVKKRLFGSTMYTHEKDADISFRMIETPYDPYMWAPLLAVRLSTAARARQNMFPKNHDRWAHKVDGVRKTQCYLEDHPSQ